MTVKAISDIGTILAHADLNDGAIPSIGFVKLVGIRSTPAKGEAPDLLDATEMDDEQTANIPGRVSVPQLEYTFNFTKENVAKLEAVAGKNHAFLEKLSDGSGHTIVGVLNYFHNGSGLNAVQEGTITITATDVNYVADADALMA